MLLVFDLDGTLVDSKKAVVEAYREAGIEPPPDFWGKPYEAWGDDLVAHEIKNDCYPDMLKKHGVRLPCADLLELSGGWVLTGASHNATLYALQFLGLMSSIDNIITGCSAAQKLQELKRLSIGCYFDDDYNFCRQVRELTQWQAIHVLS